MVPALQPGDRLLVDSRAYRDSPPAVGDVAVFVDPELSSRWLIKRVVAVGPGRFWRTRAGLVPALPGKIPPDAAPPADAVEAITLEPSTVYVMGDAPAARDSRGFGPVPFSALVGRAYRCYAPAARRRDL